MNRRSLLVASGGIVLLALLWLGGRRGEPGRTGPRSVRFAAPGVGSDPLPTLRTASGPAGEQTAEREIDRVLRSGVPDPEKAAQLLERMSSLPPGGRLEALTHALNLLPDDRFVLVRPWITSSVPRGLAEAVLSEAANRPEAVKLPLLLEILRTPNHPLQPEARLLLLPYVGIERIDDPALAAEAVAERLRTRSGD